MSSMPLRCATLVILATSFAASTATAQQPASLTLSLFAEESGEPLAGAAVAVLGTDLSALTNSQGRARIVGIAPGRYTVEVRLLGYATERLRAVFQPGESVEVELDLLIQPVELQGIDVATERGSIQLQRSGFLQRQRMGIGAFVTRQQIEQRRPMFLSDLFRGLRGVRVVAVRNGGYIVTTTRGGVRMGLDPSTGVAIRGCPMQLFLDGIHYPTTNIDDLPVTWVEGIEVYRGPAETPPRFNPTGSEVCGAIVIWTR